MTKTSGVSLRWKILGIIMVPVFVLIVVLTAAISTLVLADNAREVDDHLAREARELSLLAERASDPVTGGPLTSPRALLELYITRTIPDPNETMFVVSDGMVFARTTDSPPVRLDTDEDFLQLVTTAEQVRFGDWETAVGNARYVIVPVASESASGALVAIIFSDLDAAPMRDLLMRFALIGLASLIGMVATAYLLAGRIFRPIGALTEFASRIGGEQLQERLPVRGTGDELDQLAGEFNVMLERLEQAFDSQRQFVDVAGHELRTPLTIVRGHIDLMRSSPTEAETSMPIVADELARMSRLVQDLQTLTKSSSPDFVRPTETDLTELAADLKAKIAMLTERKVKVVAGVGSWKLDPQRISQAVLQLVENAAKYTPKRAKIELSFKALPDELRISISDAGPGIPADLAANIFEPFFRGRDTQNVEGSGIGLSIVKAIAQAHRGSVTAGRAELGGAEFVIRIPRS